MSVTNPSVVLGLDADSPAVVRTKCLSAIAARSYKGPNSAYQLAVATAVNSSSQPVAINRWSVTTDPNTGFITVYVAGPDGTAVPNDIQAVQANVNAISKPALVQAFVVPCGTVPLSANPTTITVWAVGSGDDQRMAITHECETALGLALATYPIGGHTAGTSQGYVFSSWIKGVLENADSAIYAIKNVGSDIPMGANQVAILTAATIIDVQFGATA